MNERTHKQAGFTAVELLVTLFVAAAFLIAGYQLFSVVIRDGGQTRAESKAGNIAYDYLRRYAPQATNPCTASTPLNNSAVTVDGLIATTVTVTISCPNPSTPALSKIEATIAYNSPQQTVRYATYTNGSSTSTEVTSGLIGWWQLNGNATDSIGTATGTVFGAQPTTGQGGLSNTAYVFDGVDDYIRLSGATAVGNLTNNLTMTAWIRKDNTNVSGTIFSAARTSGTQNGLAFTAMGTGLMRFTTLGVRDYDSTTASYTANGWHFVVARMSANNVTFLTEGVQRDTVTHTAPGLANTDDVHMIGAGTGISVSTLTTPFAGTIDDLRIYNRVLTNNEIQTIYNNGAR